METVCRGPIGPLSHDPSSAVAVCAELSRLLQFTRPPPWTVMVLGRKVKSRMLICAGPVTGAAIIADVAGAAAAGMAVGAGGAANAGRVGTAVDTGAWAI